MSRIYINKKKLILKKLFVLLFLLSLNAFSQEIMNESEITIFLNSNDNGTEIKMEEE